ncbi:MAG: hypothetical protein ACYSU0_15535, partial [Planctomycetota bacterium]
MNRPTLLTLCSVLLQMVGGCSSRAGEHRIVLVQDGKPNATIVIARDPTPAAHLAAIETQLFTKKITGATLPIVDDTNEVVGNRLLIGNSTFTRKLGLDASEYHQMEALVKFYPDALVLLGRDDAKRDCRTNPDVKGFMSREMAVTIDYAKANGIEGEKREVFIPGMFDYQGSLRATYRFLEKWCGVRFFGATPINLHVPEARTLTVSGSEHHHRSAIDTKHGAMGVFGRSDGVSAYGPRPSQAQAALYSRRIRWGGEPWYINHTFEHFNYKRRFFKPVKPRGDDKRKLAEYERHKGDFERVVPGMANKTGRHQFCYTTRAVIDQIAKDARDFFDGRLGENVDLMVRNLQGRSDTFFLVPFDVGGYCECQECQPLLEVGRERGLGFNVGSAS